MHIVLNSFGASIGQENGLFLISTTKGKQSLHPRDVKTVSVSKGARISSDAVLLAIQHEVDVLFIDRIGKPQGRVWSIKYGSISDIRRKQLEFMYSPKSVQWVKDLVVEKINMQIAMLLSLNLGKEKEITRLFSSAINSMEDYKRKIRKMEGETVSDIAPSIRGWEGASSKKYFQSISKCLPSTFQYEKRSRHPARDMFNSMLNYGYGILYGKVEGALIKAGIDPYAGIFHRDDYNRPALVFDVIEKYRAWIDFVIVQLCVQEALNEECFKVEENGSYYLEGLGKRIVIQSVNDYLAEVIKLKGLNRSRAEHMNRYAHQLAKLFLES